MPHPGPTTPPLRFSRRSRGEGRGRAWPRALIVAIALAAAGCLEAETGDVSGSVAVTTWGGEFRELSDLEVALVPRTTAFDDEWRALRLKYGDEYAATSGDPAASPARAGKLADIEAAYHAAQRSYAGSSAVARTKTDAHGGYRFTGVSAGRYYLFCAGRVRDAAVGWMVPVEVAGGSATVNLSNGNEGALKLAVRD
jgi:hypothetical protein